MNAIIRNMQNRYYAYYEFYIYKITIIEAKDTFFVKK